ncbi:MAG TPA: tRNA preQ1(34) S-adenosylmethionine ribosyltransferase-isomerase QueA [Pyrinomonadaceae bacterium]|nr:tRNA preQ1(34) S-adenosylmethionine ribosyltransferase-isomerase QueA [Pyrinomonadaceae bacterium]
MLISDFDYELPEELIAQRPAERRDASRLLVVERESATWRERTFTQLPEELRAGDCLVVNDTRVFPARLAGRREPSGGRVELLLVRELEGRAGEERAGRARVWEALAKPARRLTRGTRATFAGGRLRAEVVEEREDGRRVVRFETDEDFDAVVEESGRMPLPPYIKRDEHDAAARDFDRERYQTVYAERRGAIAAPTAGLHFTPRVLEEARARGVTLARVTLHVGYGTFAPVRAEDLSEHHVAAERFEITDSASRIINDARASGGRVVAVGTTTVRALESVADERGRVRAGRGETSLTITPGYAFRAVDALVTNFHLPRSSLLVLVASFAGRELTLAAYRHAVAARFRFYSYGDCMLIK